MLYILSELFKLLSKGTLFLKLNIMHFENNLPQHQFFSLYTSLKKRPTHTQYSQTAHSQPHQNQQKVFSKVRDQFVYVDHDI